MFQKFDVSAMPISRLARKKRKSWCAALWIVNTFRVCTSRCSRGGCRQRFCDHGPIRHGSARRAPSGWSLVWVGWVEWVEWLLWLLWLVLDAGVGVRTVKREADSFFHHLLAPSRPGEGDEAELANTAY